MQQKDYTKVNKMDSKNLNLLGIIAIIGAVLLVVGVFMTWLSNDFATYSGWKVFNNEDGIKDAIKYGYVPILALVCGIISLVLMIVPTVMNVDKFKQINDILGIIALILAIVVIILGLLWYTQSIDVVSIFGLKYTAKLTELYSVGTGFWLTIVGAVITAVGGLMPIVKNKLL